ncbi:MAG: hypothetical protein A3B69_00355 [Gammaproteobacteria bacterium RIFCSPHIGHO2_02_FULL_38_33]|nr:MAG: hypothetical protein A3B69_00355 [Gammaproteobacteria bacterium RIFCSPHIGHO2_02_FULL_38_33]
MTKIFEKFGQSYSFCSREKSLETRPDLSFFKFLNEINRKGEMMQCPIKCFNKCISVLSPRVVSAISFICLIGLLGFSRYLQTVKDLEPCALCIVQRLAFMGLAVLFFIDVIFPRWFIRRVLHIILSVVFVGVGMLAALRQVWLMHHVSAEKIASCEADLYYMIQYLPLKETIMQIIRSPGNCSKEAWYWLGLSLPVWSCLGLLFFLAVAIWVNIHGSAERALAGNLK